MRKPEELPEVTDQVLSGLKADDALKYRILQTAAKRETPAGENVRFAPVPVLCSLVALLLVSILWLNGKDPVVRQTPGEISTFTAGGQTEDTGEISDSSAPTVLPEDIDLSRISSVELDGVGELTDAEGCARLIKALSETAELMDSPPEQPLASQLIIRDKDGRSVVLSAKKPFLQSEEGCWTCPAFFELLEAEMK